MDSDEARHEHTSDAAGPDQAAEATTELANDSVDLDRIERELEDVEVALQRLDAGTYWTDETSGEPIPDEALASDPLTRRAP